MGLVPLLAAAALAAGCSGKPAAWHGKEVDVYVDADRLTRLNPAWARVLDYDRLIASTAQPPAPGDLNGLPRTAELASIAPPAEAHIGLALKDQRTRLEAVRLREVRELTDRLRDAREHQLNTEASKRRIEANALVTDEKANASINYALETERAVNSDDAYRINLQMQIPALVKLIKLWDRDSPPELKASLEKLRSELELKQKLLADDSTKQNELFARLDTQYQEELTRADRDGAALMARLRAEREQVLRNDDVGRIAAADRDLSDDMQTLLGQVAAAENRDWLKSSPPRQVTVGYSWPQVDLTNEAAARLAAAQKLRSEQDHWIGYVYANTHAAVNDLASARHWRVSFSRGRGRRDMTNEVAGVLTASVWKVAG